MKKLFLPLAVLCSALLTVGCDKGNGFSNNLQFDDATHTVTGAVINLYERTEYETNYEIYLLLDGTRYGGDIGGAVYFDMYFDWEVYDLPAGTYVMASGNILDSGEYFYNTETEEKDVNLTSGTLTVSRSGDNYTFTFEGKAIDYYTDPGTAEEKPFSCSYSGPVEYREDGDGTVGFSVTPASEPSRMMEKRR